MVLVCGSANQMKWDGSPLHRGRRFIPSLIVFPMMVVISVGCFAMMTPEQRQETYDMRKKVQTS